MGCRVMSSMVITSATFLEMTARRTNKSTNRYPERIKTQTIAGKTDIKAYLLLKTLLKPLAQTNVLQSNDETEEHAGDTPDGKVSGNRVDQVGGEDEAREDDIADELLDEVCDNSTTNKLQLK